LSGDIIFVQQLIDGVREYLHIGYRLADHVPPAYSKGHKLSRQAETGRARVRQMAQIGHPAVTPIHHFIAAQPIRTMKKSEQTRDFALISYCYRD
jgi:hypothetical protein